MSAQETPQMMHAVEPLVNLDDERLRALKEKFKAMEVHNTLGLDVTDMCLLPDMVIPQKFKVLDFEKYKGVSCPWTHLRAYCRKMDTYVDNNKLLIHYF